MFKKSQSKNCFIKEEHEHEILTYLSMQQLNLYRTQIGNGELKLILVANKGKSFLEALILASTNPQYDKRFFIELRVQYMKISSSEHVKNIVFLYVHHVHKLI